MGVSFLNFSHVLLSYFLQAFNSIETLSISSQFMNRNNYLVVLEEIIKGKNIKRNKLPAHFSTLLPPDQVSLTGDHTM